MGRGENHHIRSMHVVMMTETVWEVGEECVEIGKERIGFSTE